MSDKVNVQPFKDTSSRYPPELKALIDSCPDEMSDEEFLAELTRSRKVARRIDADREVQK